MPEEAPVMKTDLSRKKQARDGMGSMVRQEGKEVERAKEIKNGGRAGKTPRGEYLLLAVTGDLAVRRE